MIECDKQQLRFKATNPTPYAVNFKSVVFTANGVGYVCGEKKLFMMEGDGKTLELVHEGDHNINAVYALDDSHIYAVTDGGYLLTSENGKQWVEKKVCDVDLKAVFYKDTYIGCLAGNSNELYATFSGGRSFMPVVGVEGYSIVNSIYGTRVNGVVGAKQNDVVYMCCTIGRLLKSNDGVSYNEIKMNRFQNLNAICFSDQSMSSGVIVGNCGTVLTTNDPSGEVWEDASLTWNLNLNSVCFAFGHWYVVGNGGVILKNPTGANTDWKVIVSDTQIRHCNLNSISFDEKRERLCCVGDGGTVKMIDKKDNVTLIGRGNRSFLRSVWACSDGETIYSVGGCSSIIKSKDGGDKWYDKTCWNNEYSNLRAVAFPKDELVGYAVSTTGTIIKTETGIRWNVVCRNDRSLYNIFMLDEQYGYCCGSKGTVLRTSDGETFGKMPTHINENLYGLYFKNYKEGLFCGENGVILRTASGGKGFIKQVLDGGYDMYSITGHNEESDLYIAVGQMGYIVVRTAPTTWERIKVEGIDENLYCVKIFNDRIYICGQRGMLLVSDDFGSTFEQIDTGTENNLYGMAFTDKKLTLCGQNGLVLTADI